MMPASTGRARILQLLVSPEGGEPVDVVAQHVAALSGGRGKIEQCSVGVKNAGLHAAEWNSAFFCHESTHLKILLE